MKQTLFLTSMGIRPDFQTEFLSKLPKLPSKMKVSYITTAAYDIDGGLEFIEYNRNVLKKYGFIDIEDFDLRNHNTKDLLKHFEDKDLIYMKGGNTFFLLYWIRKSGFDKVLPLLLEKGLIYVGISAGTYVICPNIEQATWKHPERNTVKLTDLSALNLIPFIITCHFEEKWREIVENAAKITSLPIVALNNDQAILIEDNDVKFLGKGKREFFNGFKM